MRSPSSLATRFKFFEADFAGLIIVEKTERLQDLVLRITVQNLVRHHLQELFVSDGAAAVVVNVGNHFLDFLLLRLKTQCTHRDLQLLGVNFSTAVRIEEV